MKSVFEFIDYRQFLKAFYQQKKAQSRRFSFRYFAERTGINSSSFLKHIMEGRRNLTAAACEKFLIALELGAKEATYFRHLVAFNQARTAAEKQEQYAVLRSLAGNVRETVLKTAQYDYFAHWYIPVIRELVCIGDFGDDAGALGRAIHPPIGAVEARQGVRLLEKLGMIRRRADGRYEQQASAVTADDSVTSLAQRTYVATMMRLSAEAVQAFDRAERHTSTLTLGISAPTYEVLTAEIEAFKDRVKSIVSQDQITTRVYQLNLALFPVSISTGTPQSDVKEAPQ